MSSQMALPRPIASPIIVTHKPWSFKDTQESNSVFQM